MPNYNIFEDVSGNEALTVPERISRFFAELSLGIDKFNANYRNKSIHTVKVGNTFKLLKTANNYFDVSFKHIASPVLFDPKKLKFEEYVDLCLQAVGAMKIVSSVADNIYRGIKTTAAKGQVPVSMGLPDTAQLVLDMKYKTDELLKAGNPSTRAVSELYPNWTVADSLFQRFNQVTADLKSRDAEVLAKSVTEVIAVAEILKRKVKASEIILDGNQIEVLDDALTALSVLVNHVGFMLHNLSELTRLFEIHTEQLIALKK